MRKHRKNTALIFAFLIVTEFVSSGYHVHEHRRLPESGDNVVSLTTGMQGCLCCEGVFSYTIAPPRPETDLHKPSGMVRPVSVSVTSKTNTLLTENKAPPFSMVP